MRSTIVAVAFALSLLVPAGAGAEWFFDVYAGRSWSRSTDIDVRGTDSLGVAVRGSLMDVDLEDSPLYGARLGYWLGIAPVVGFALDGFYFEPDLRSQTVTTTAAFTGRIFDEPITATASGPVRVPSADVPAGVATLSLMLRAPLLATPELPQGQLQPYVGAGPAALVTDADEIDATIGLAAFGGIAWQFSHHVAVFAEYRFTHFRPDVESGGLRFEGDLDTHHVLGGISLRF